LLAPKLKEEPVFAAVLPNPVFAVLVLLPNPPVEVPKPPVLVELPKSPPPVLAVLAPNGFEAALLPNNEVEVFVVLPKPVVEDFVSPCTSTSTILGKIGEDAEAEAGCHMIRVGVSFRREDCWSNAITAVDLRDATTVRWQENNTDKKKG
jgi:hypothetical protein